ncbi:MAG: sodium:proton exchanger [Bacteroidetes bacterium HGW-Bacteroidetes-15]|nr:MAG: sodium:proton exchanger [Bacteroidetes bacterium HGW-Bacteroidetes-15]
MESAAIIVFVGLIVFASHLFTGIFERKRIPDVLLLMIIGLILGPILGLISPDDFGIAGPMFTTITLVIILFEGGLALRFDALKQAIRGTTALTTINFFVTMGVVGVIGWLVFGLHPVAGFMLGAILGGTSSAVVIPMVQQLRITEDTKTILVLESAVSDVLCIIFALALLETFHVEEVKIGLVLGKIISSFTLAALLGWGGAMAWSILLNKVRTIRNTIFTTPAFVFIIFGIAELFGYSGAISALAFGITLANIEIFNVSLLKKYVADKPITLNETEKVFFGEIVFLLKTFFFIYIGLSIQLQNLWALVLGLLLTIIIFSTRVPVVKIAIRKPLPTFDLTMISVMVPKGLAAAVLASIPFQQGIEGGEFIRDITYAVILLSIVFSSVLIPLVEKSSVVRGVYGLMLRKGFMFWRKPKPIKDSELNH